MKTHHDVLIIGCGIAGLYTALSLPENINVTILSKNSYKKSNSYLAQGGIAAAIDPVNDSPSLHFEDTLKCGNYKNDKEAVLIFVNEAAEMIHKLNNFGIDFDKDKSDNILLAKEGAHSVPRIAHSGDHTGKTVLDALYDIAQSKSNIKIYEDVNVIDLITINNTCYGVSAIQNNKLININSKSTVLATGGIGQLFETTTNAQGINGDGIAMVLRSGGHTKDMNYVQFHPTAFYNPNDNTIQSFLITEAIRGEGAIIRDKQGSPIMEKAHPLKDLAPRDFVSKTIMNVLNTSEESHVYLDVTHLSKEKLQKRFPSVFKYCLDQGIDISKEWIPIKPCMHYFMGGIKVDINGKSSINRLYACGECACTGLHGQNRLASNSLSEALVFGNRIAKDIKKCINTMDFSSIKNEILPISNYSFYSEYNDMTARKWMSKYFGIERTKKGLEKLKSNLSSISEKIDHHDINSYTQDSVNKLIVIFKMIEEEENATKLSD